MPARESSGPVRSVTTAFVYVGNIGCVRFPVPIRKSSGIKRGDRLAVTVLDLHSVLLEKRSIPDWAPIRAPAEVTVEGCACAEVPDACETPLPEWVTVGWSYVQLEEKLSRRLGFLPDAPVKLEGEPERITVTLHNGTSDLRDVIRSNCPP